MIRLRRWGMGPSHDLYLERTTEKHGQTSVSRVGFEITIQVFEGRRINYDGIKIKYYSTLIVFPRLSGCNTIFLHVSSACTGLTITIEAQEPLQNLARERNSTAHAYCGLSHYYCRKKSIQFAKRQVLWQVNVLVTSRKNSMWNSDGDGELYGIVELKNSDW
jgi:hypothetical protein